MTMLHRLTLSPNLCQLHGQRVGTGYGNLFGTFHHVIRRICNPGWLCKLVEHVWSGHPLFFSVGEPVTGQHGQESFGNESGVQGSKYFNGFLLMGLGAKP